MAQCDVHANEAPSSRAYAPYVLDVQADLLGDLDTRVVVPLVRAELFGRRIDRLHPAFEIDDETFVMATHLLAGVARRDLGARKTNLLDQRYTILAAIDMLLSGI
jgi:toxin CcdB